MKHHVGIAMVAAALLLAVPLEAFAREGKVRGKFVRLTEKKIGDRECVGAVIVPNEGKDEVIVFMGRDSKLLPSARKLIKGQQVEIAYATEAGQKWIKRIGAPAAEGKAKGKHKPAKRADARAAKGHAKGKKKPGKRVDVKGRGPSVRGKFLRLSEEKVGEREHLAVVVQPQGSDGEVTVLVGRDGKLAAAARKLRKGQQVEVSYVTKGKQKWARRIGPPAAEGQVKGKKKPGRRADAPARKGQVKGKFLRLSEKKVGEREHLVIVIQPQGSDKQVVVLVGRRGEAAAKGIKDVKDDDREIRMLRARLDQLEKKIKAFRAENARLEKLLREKREATATEEAPRP